MNSKGFHYFKATKYLVACGTSHISATLEQIGTGKLVTNENVSYIYTVLSRASLYLIGTRRIVSCGMVRFVYKSAH
jgi:hypothetical protein